MIKRTKKSEGFTLVELLVSIVILVAIGSIISGMVSSSLKGTRKTNIVENIRQNGNDALTQMAKDIEYAQVFNGVSDNGETYIASCFNLSPTPSPTYSSIKITPLNSDPIIYNCADSLFTRTATDGASLSLIDASSVELTECKITCSQVKLTDIPLITISFKLGPKIRNGVAEDSSPPILFRTSVTVRNYRN